jgi:hypothetical protein
MAKGTTGAAAGGGALYGLGVFGALFYYWQQADSFWEYVWAIFPKAIFWPAYMVFEGFRALGACSRRCSRFRASVIEDSSFLGRSASPSRTTCLRPASRRRGLRRNHAWSRPGGLSSGQRVWPGSGSSHSMCPSPSWSRAASSARTSRSDGPTGPHRHLGGVADARRRERARVRTDESRGVASS